MRPVETHSSNSSPTRWAGWALGLAALLVIAQIVVLFTVYAEEPENMGARAQFILDNADMDRLVSGLGAISDALFVVAGLLLLHLALHRNDGLRAVSWAVVAVGMLLFFGIEVFLMFASAELAATHADTPALFEASVPIVEGTLIIGGIVTLLGALGVWSSEARSASRVVPKWAAYAGIVVTAVGLAGGLPVVPVDLMYMAMLVNALLFALMGVRLVTADGIEAPATPHGTDA